MRLTTPGRPHLSYCSNVHRGESWQDLRATLTGPIASVARLVAGGARFGIGLRVAARAARELRDRRAREEIARVLREMNAYVFTINGFPFGRFHDERVKESVFRPDWRESERLTYTKDLIDLLAAILPAGVVGSISTVPGAFAPRAHEFAHRRAVADLLVDAAAYLAETERRTGRVIMLALEPEPACLLETAADAASFFCEHLFSAGSRSRFARSTGTDDEDAEPLLRRHLGVCLDACHLSVGFESPLDAIASVTGAGIAIAKIQVSAGVEVEGAEAARALLPALDDGVYLHQTSIATTDGRIRRYLDLPSALRDPAEGIWRVHLHVPVDRVPAAPLKTTRRDLEALLRHLRDHDVTPHLEVETYTWDVLPQHLRGKDVIEDIANELSWTRRALEGR